MPCSTSGVHKRTSSAEWIFCRIQSRDGFFRDRVLIQVLPPTFNYFLSCFRFRPPDDKRPLTHATILSRHSWLQDQLIIAAEDVSALVKRSGRCHAYAPYSAIFNSASIGR